MAKRIEISCINKVDHMNLHERIKHVGGTSSLGRWKKTLEKAIQEIENDSSEFYVSKGGHNVNVKVATRNGKKYLKTENDGDSPDNLLSLPECP